MLSENIILQSAGSLSVAVMALLMLILQTLFFFRKPQSTWYAWSAAIAFSALLYSVGIFIEYNTPAGPLNRFSGLLEWTAIVCLAHCLYGFTFSYLGIESKRYHPVAGVCHGLILILLWSTNYIVSESFTTRDFIGLESPYTEPALGPLGPVFVLYAATAGVIAMIIWIKHKRTDSKHRIAFLAGMGLWLLLGIHDGLASLGLPTLQYFMEYGFLGFAMVVLWVVFNSYLEIAAEDKYRVITEFANDGIMVIQDGKMVFRNPAGCDLIGVPLTDSEPRDFLDIMVSEDRKTVLEHYNTLLEDGHAANPHTVRIRGADGEQRFAEIASSLIQYRNRPAVLVIMRDMTERKRAEEALGESEEKYRNLVELLPQTVFELDERGFFTYSNRFGLESMGYTQADLDKGLNAVETVIPEDRARVKENMERRLRGEGLGPHEYTALRKDGSRFPFIIYSTPLIRDDKPVGIRGVSVDITERKLIEEQLKASLKEKEVLLKEIHHRVKNNLQIISSLLDLTRRRTENQEAVDLLSDARAKVHTMALIHTQLYQSDRFDRINMGGYIKELVGYLSQIYARESRLVTPVIEPSEIYLSMTQAMPCALALNEVISNAFKHAFQEGQKGTIRVSLDRSPGDRIFIRVKDNGIGIPEEVDILKTDSLGLKLFRNLVQEQLMGEIRLNRDRGTDIFIEFNVLKEKDSNA